MVIIGGMGNVWGAILGAFVIEGLNFWLLPSLTKWGNAAGLNIDFSSWNMLIFGVLLVTMMLFRPQGFIPSKARTLTFDDDHQGAPVQHAAPLVDVEPGRPGVQHYPGGLHGPDGDAAHAMHPGLEVGRESHASSEQQAAAPAHEPEQLPGPSSSPTEGRRFTSRFQPGSNPFGATT
ncbi:MAG: hypothetical protein KDC46_16015, partial [Thermoleophilia bacterium]|nr:hypothetical protein [Thermoleophilia bacterium]